MSEIIQNSPLLALPGEIRNDIYEYVLTSSHALEYESESSGLPKLSERWLKNHPDQAEALLAAQAASHKDFSGSIFREPGTKNNFNQLKNVCKQLAAETSDLDDNFRTAVTVVAGKYHPFVPNAMKKDQLRWQVRASAFSRLNEMLGARNMARLRKVVIKTNQRGSISYNSDTYFGPHEFQFFFRKEPDWITKFDDFCLAHPNIKVHYLGPHIPYADVMDEKVSISHMVLYGVAMTYALRGVDLSAIAPVTYRNDRLWKTIDTYESPGFRLGADNLILEIVDEEFKANAEVAIGQLTQTYHWKQDIEGDGGQTAPYAVGMEHLRKWVMDGI